MDPDYIIELFKKYQEEYYLKTNQWAMPSDLFAFNLLHRIHPTMKSIIAGAEHDQIWLSTSLEDLVDSTPGDIMTLVKCGVMYDEETESLFMFA